MAPRKVRVSSTTNKATPQKEHKETRSNLLDIITMSFVVFGLAISFYAIMVEYKAKLDSEYVALCDLSPSVSCSKVLTSEYSRLFSHLGLVPKDSPLNQPNTVYGILYYVAFGVSYSQFRAYSWGKLLLLALAATSLTLCAYLAYILTVILADVCIVCYLTYLCNIVLFISAVSNA